MRYPELIKFINNIIEQRGLDTTLTHNEVSTYELALKQNPLLQPLMLFYPAYFKSWQEIIRRTSRVLAPTHQAFDSLDVHDDSYSASRAQAEPWLITTYPPSAKRFFGFFWTSPPNIELNNFLDEIIHEVNQGTYNNTLLFMEKNRCIEKAISKAKKFGKKESDYLLYLQNPKSIEQIKEETQKYLNFLKNNMYYSYSYTKRLLSSLKKWVDSAPGEESSSTLPLKKRADRLGAVLESLDDSRTAYVIEELYFFVGVSEFYSCFAGVNERLLDRAFLIKEAEEASRNNFCKQENGEMLPCHIVNAFLDDFVIASRIAVSPTDALYQAYLQAAGYQIQEIKREIFVLKHEPDTPEYQKAFKGYLTKKTAIIHQKWDSYLEKKAQKNHMTAQERRQLKLLQSELKKYMCQNNEIGIESQEDIETLVSQETIEKILSENFLDDFHKITSDIDNIHTIPSSLHEHFMALGAFEMAELEVLVAPSEGLTAASCAAIPPSKEELVAKMADIIGFGSAHIEILLTLIGQNIRLGENPDPVSAGLRLLQSYATDQITYLDKKRFQRFEHQLWLETAAKKYESYAAFLHKKAPRKTDYHTVPPYYIELWPPRVKENEILRQEIEKELLNNYIRDFSLCDISVLIEEVKSNRLLQQEPDRKRVLRKLLIQYSWNPQYLELLKLLLDKGIDFSDDLDAAAFVLNKGLQKSEYRALLWDYFKDKPYLNALFSLKKTPELYATVFKLQDNAILQFLEEKNVFHQQACITIILDACVKKDVKVIDWIMSHKGAQYRLHELVYAPHNQKYNKLTLAELFMFHGLWDHAQKALKETTSLVHQKSSVNALTLALDSGHADLLKTLQEHPDINSLINYKAPQTEYPIVAAIMKSQMRAFDWLVEQKKANLDITVSGKGLLSYVLSKNQGAYEEFAIKLFKAGAPGCPEIFRQAVLAKWARLLNELLQPKFMDYIEPDTQEPTLITVVRYRNLDLAIRMLEHGANLSVLDKEGKNILHHLAGYQFVTDPHYQPLVEALIEKELERSVLNARSYIGQTPLEIAYRTSNTFLIDKLNALGALNTLEGAGSIAVFIKLIKNQCIKYALDLFNTFSQDAKRTAVNQYLPCGTPVLAALLASDLQGAGFDAKNLLQIFSDAGVDFTRQAPHNGCHALGVAIKKGDLNVAREILSLDKSKKLLNDPYHPEKDAAPTTPLEHAISLNHVDCAQMLLDAGAVLDPHALSLLNRAASDSLVGLVIDHLIVRGHHHQEILRSLINNQNINGPVFDTALEHLSKIEMTEPELAESFATALTHPSGAQIWQKMIDFFDVGMGFFKRNMIGGKTLFEACFLGESFEASACALVLLENGMPYDQAEQNVNNQLEQKSTAGNLVDTYLGQHIETKVFFEKIALFFKKSTTDNQQFQQMLAEEKFHDALGLLKKGACGTSKDVVAAFETGNMKKLALLLAAGTPLPQNTSAETYLMQAVRQGNVCLVKILLAAAQENLFYQNAQGQTVFQIAQHVGNDKITRLLEKQFNDQARSCSLLFFKRACAEAVRKEHELHHIAEQDDTLPMKRIYKNKK